MTRSFAKKLLAGTSATAFALGAIAGSAEAQSVFDGFYGGATVGYYHFNADNFKDDFVACCATGTNTGGNHSGDSLNIGLLGGYGLTFDRLYVGGEANGSFNVHAETGGFFVSHPFGCGFNEGLAAVSSKNSVGAGIRVGYLFTPTILGFVKAGAQGTEFTASYQELNCDSPNAPAHGTRVWGAQLGTGSDIQIPSGMSLPLFLRLEYDHTFFPSTSINSRTNLTGEGGLKEGHVLHFDPSEDIFKIGLVFYFGGPRLLPPPATSAAPTPPVAVAQAGQPQLFVVPFNFSKSDLTADGAKAIHEAADYFKAHGAMRLEIASYSDSAGSQSRNPALAELRSACVTREMEKRGVPASVIAAALQGKEAVATAEARKPAEIVE